MGKKQILIRLDDETAKKLETVKKQVEKQGYPAPSDSQIALKAVRLYLDEMLKGK